MVGGSYHMPYPDVYLYDYDLHPLASLAAGLLGEKLGARGGGDAERGDLACRFLLLITALVGGCFVVESQRAKRLRYGATGREAQPLQHTPAGASKA